MQLLFAVLLFGSSSEPLRLQTLRAKALQLMELVEQQEIIPIGSPIHQRPVPQASGQDAQLTGQIQHLRLTGEQTELF